MQMLRYRGAAKPRLPHALHRIDGPAGVCHAARGGNCAGLAQIEMLAGSNHGQGIDRGRFVGSAKLQSAGHDSAAETLDAKCGRTSLALRRLSPPPRVGRSAREVFTILKGKNLVKTGRRWSPEGTTMEQTGLAESGRIHKVVASTRSTLAKQSRFLVL